MTETRAQLEFQAVLDAAVDVVDSARVEVVLISHLQRILGTAAPHALL